MAKDVGAQPKITANGILKGDGSGNITAANETEVELVSLPNICNPNLLDNWYFGNPVNQRDGYLVYEGANLYTDATCTTVAGTASGGPYQAYPISSICVSFTTNATYYCKIGDAGVVRGYTGSQYTIDRWRIGSSGTLTIQNGYITFSSNDEIGRNLEEYLDDLPAGTYTLSALVENGAGARLITGVNDTFYAANISDDSKQVVSVTFVKTTTGRVTVYLQCTNKAVSWFAVKLELGSQQTLAHQENGAWVLNEIPDYGEQLRRCQRYQLVTNREIIVAGRTSVSADTTCFAFIPTPVTMRVAPAISKISGNYIATVNHVNGAKSIVDFTNVSLAGNGIYVTGAITAGLGTTQPITVIIPRFIADANL